MSRGSRGGGRGRGRGGRKPWKNLPTATDRGSDGQVVNRTIGGEEIDQSEDRDHDNDDDDVGKDKSARGGAAGAVGGKFSMEEEMSRYIAKRGNVYASSIIVLARQKFLGYFRDERSAQLAFEAAYHQRENGLNSSQPLSSSALVTVGGGVGSAGNAMAQGKIVSKFKGKISKDVKLSDGSFISDEFYRFFDEETLTHDIQSLLIPQHAAKAYLSDWITTYNQPPAYAVLRGRDGGEIHLPSLACVLGQMTTPLASLFDKLGMPTTCATGLIYDYAAPNPLTAGSEVSNSSGNVAINSLYQKILTSPVCCLHTSFDHNIAAQHAFIKYNPTIGKFEIKALTEAGIFINGNVIRPLHGFIPLNSKTILQFGSHLFIFLLPLKKDIISSASLSAAMSKKDNPLLLRRNTLRCLVESVKLRNSVLTESAINSELKIQKLEMLESQTIMGVSLTKDHPTSLPAPSTPHHHASSTNNTNHTTAPSSSNGAGQKERRKSGVSTTASGKKRESDDMMDVDDDDNDNEDLEEGDEEEDEDEEGEEDDLEEEEEYEDEVEEEEGGVVGGGDDDDSTAVIFTSGRDQAQIAAAMVLTNFAQSLQSPKKSK